MKNIIVTGGLGHIGSKLMSYLLDKNYNIFCIDNLSTQRFTSLRGLIGNERFHFLKLDISHNTQLLSDAFKDQPIDCVIHLAAITDAEASHGKAKEVHDNNFNSTKNIVEFCNTKKAKLLFPSSTSVYGSAEAEVYEDNDDFLNPQSPYAESKINEEKYIISNVEGKYNILRLGTIFGVSPGMRFHTAVNKFCWQAALNSPITVWKTALDQYRPYLDINDASNAMNFFITEDHENQVFNVLTDNYTVQNILDSIQVFQDIEISFVESKIMNQLSYFVRNKKIQSLGFKFEGDLAQSIQDTFEWLR